MRGQFPANAFRILLPWLGFIAFYFIFPDYLALGTAIILNIILVMSLDLVIGHAGIVTLGHGVFFGIGAYAAGLFSVHVHPDPLFGLAFAVILSGLFGLVSGAMILHTTGHTLLMLTLAISSLVAEFANRAYTITGGNDGLSIPTGELLGTFRFGLYGDTAYFYSLSVLLLWFILLRAFVHSPFCKSLNGIRQNRSRMRTLGAPVWSRLVAVYALSAAVAGSAGAIMAQTTKYISLNSLGILVSGMAVIMLVLGGVRSLYGAFIGAGLYLVLQDYFSKSNPYHWMFIIGVLLICSVLFKESGFWEKLGKRLRFSSKSLPVLKASAPEK